MSVRTLVERGKFDRLAPEDFTIILQMLDDDAIAEKAFEALRAIISKSSGVEAEIEANNLINYISGKTKGAKLALKLLPEALNKAPKAAGYAFTILSSLLDLDEFREEAKEIALQLAKSFPNEARLIRYKLNVIAGQDPRVKDLGESVILTKGVSVKHNLIDLSTPFSAREGLRKVIRLFQIGPSFQFADAIVAAASFQPEIAAEFLPDIVQLIDKYAVNLPDISLRLCDALELLLEKEKEKEAYLAPLSQTLTKVKDGELKSRLEAIIKKYANK